MPCFGACRDVDELDDVFERATPKFVDPDPTRDAREMHNVQLRQLKQEVSQRLHVLPGLRSYLRLYTNIDTEKLAGFTKSTREQVQYVFRTASHPTCLPRSAVCAAPCTTHARDEG